MTTLKMHSPNLVDDNIAKIATLFPNCITEKPKTDEQGNPLKDKDGNIILETAIDFDQLKQELSHHLIDGNQERYRLDWVGKKEAILTANSPIAKTLRPCRDESVKFDTTSNLFIEGDNLEALKLLQESYLGAVKMIYIDPPYNTGNDFIYNDDFSEDTESFFARSGQVDDNGNRLIANTESNGRFHSDWLSMMYSRLKLARNLLSDDGVIFISIDDNEVHNLRKICDEIFGAGNFVACIVVEGTPKNDPYIVSTAHEYCLVYTRNFEIAKTKNYGISNPIYKDLSDIFNNNINKGSSIVEVALKEYYETNKLKDDNISNYKYCDEFGIFRTGPIDDPQSSGAKDERLNPKTGKPCKTPNRGWSCSIETWNEWLSNNLIYFPESDDVLPAKKTYISENRLDVLRAYFKIQTRKDTDNLKRMFGTEMTVFSNPKPLDLIKEILSINQDDNFIVLDFFAGSGTTAHAVYELNSKFKKNIKFITIQIPEILNVKNANSNKAKKIIQTAIDFCTKNNLPTTIAEISKERIRRAGAKIKAENVGKDGIDTLDTGFRVLKIDTSNMADIYYRPDDYRQDLLDDLVDTVKADRSDEDLLFGFMLDMGVALSLPIERTSIGGHTVYQVGGNSLVASLDYIDTQMIDDIARLAPIKFVTSERAIATDSDKTNIIERFKQLSPHTDVRFI